MVISLERGANNLHMVHCHPIVSCFVKIQIGLTFLVPAYRGSPLKITAKWVFVNNVQYFGDCKDIELSL